MNPTPSKHHTSEDIGSSTGVAITTSPSAPPEGSEGMLPLLAPEAPNTYVETEKPSRAGQIGEGSYEGTDGYAKRIDAYLRTNDIEKNAAAAAPDSPGEARELLEAETEAASRSNAPGR